MLAGNIRSHTTTHDRASFLILNTFKNLSVISSIGKALVLKSSGSTEATVQLLLAVKLVLTVGAELTDPTS